MKVLSIILPVYRPRRGVARTAKRLCHQARLLPCRAEVIVAAAPGVALEPIGPDSGSVFVDLKVLRGDGQSSRMDPARAGVLGSRGDYVLVLGETRGISLTELLKLMPHFERGAHVVIGSRFLEPSAVRSQSWYGRALQAAVSCLGGLALLGGIRDMHSGFTCFVGPVARQLYAASHGAGQALELQVLALARQLGYVLVEVPVRWQALGGRAAGSIGSLWSTVTSLLLVRWRADGRRHRAARLTT